MPPVPFDLIPAAVVALDRADRITHWTAAAADLFVLPPGAHDRPIGLLVPRHTAPHWSRAVAAARTNGGWAGELRLQTAGGDERLVDARLAVGPDGELVAAFADRTGRSTEEAASRRGWERRTAGRLARAAADELRAAAGPALEAKADALDALFHPEPPADGVDPSPGSVLVVSAGPLTREGLRLALEARGMPVLTAADGSEAADVFDADRTGVRAVVVDADLPGWGAASAVEALRRRDPLLPVVVLGDPSVARLGADDVRAVVPKPAKAADVAWAIGECGTAGG